MSVKYDPLWLLFFLSGVLLAEDNDIPEFLKFDTTLYGQRNNGYKLNTLDYSNNGPSTCLSSHIGKNSDNEDRESCDFWWKNYFGDLIHTGGDFQVGTNEDHVDIGSFSFGMVKTAFYEGGHELGTVGKVSVEMLMDSGEVVFANFYHLDNKTQHLERQKLPDGKLPNDGVEHYPTVNSGDYIVRGQLIGKEGNTGLGISNWHDSTHLHLDFSNLPGSSTIKTENACSSEEPECSLENTTSFVKDDLVFYYDKTEVSDGKGRVYYNPDVILDSRKALIPVIYGSQNREKLDQLFGYVDEYIQAELNIKREEEKKFNSIGVVYSKSLQRNTLLQPNQTEIKNLFNETTISSGTTQLSDNKAFSAGDYVFSAYADDGINKTFGYPVKYSILNKNQLIIDNDQQDFNNTAKVQITHGDLNTASSIPGYYLTSLLFPPEERVSVRWKPEVRGKFSIALHIPNFEVSSRSFGKFLFCPNGVMNLKECKQLEIEPNPNSNEWVTLKDKDGNWYFPFNKDSFISMSSINDENTIIDAVKFSYIGKELLKIRREMNTAHSDEIINHYMNYSFDVDVYSQSDSSDKITYSFEEINKVQYSTYSNSHGKVYINRLTHNVSSNPVKCKKQNGEWSKDSVASLCINGVIKPEEK